MTNSNYPILQLRGAITSSDYERLVKFYCDGLGLEPAAIWNNDGARALMLEMGQATLELFDERQAEVIDQLEAGKRVSGQIRFHGYDQAHQKTHRDKKREQKHDLLPTEISVSNIAEEIETEQRGKLYEQKSAQPNFEAAFLHLAAQGLEI